MSTQAIGSNVDLGTGVTELVKPNDYRVALIIGSHATATVFWGLNTDNIAAAGIPIAALGQPLILSEALHGNIVRQAIRARASALATTITVIEVLDHDR